MARLKVWWCPRKRDWAWALRLAQKLRADVEICPAFRGGRGSEIAEDRLLQLQTPVGRFRVRGGRVEMLPSKLPIDEIAETLAAMYEETKDF